MDRLQKIILFSLISTSAISWLLSLSAEQSGGMMITMTTMNGMTSLNPMTISIFTANWTAGMAAMMFPAISPIVLLYNRIIKNVNSSKSKEGEVSTLIVKGGEKKSWSSSLIPSSSYSLKIILFVGCYLVVWSLTGLILLLAWSAPMSVILAKIGPVQLGIIFGTILIVSGLYQFSPLKAKCLGYCESPMSFFLRRWRGYSTIGAVKMGTYHGMYCLGCCWPYFLLMMALGWMNLLWMGLFAGIIFGEKVWSRGIWIARIAGIGLVIVGITTSFGLTTVSSGIMNANENNNINMNNNMVMDNSSNNNPSHDNMKNNNKMDM